MDQDKNKRKKLYSAFVLTFIMFLVTPGTVLL